MPGSARETLMDRVTEIARRAAERAGVEVWDIELVGAGKNRILRIFLDKPEGITLSDCETVSQYASELLDTEDVMADDSYQLEVSSPGVERKLARPEHFARFAGHKARIALREPVEQRRRWEGVLAGVEEPGVVVLSAGPDQTIRIRMDQIEKANLKFEW
jgi:ribosome maturation factor RimP